MFRQSKVMTNLWWGTFTFMQQKDYLALILFMQERQWEHMADKRLVIVYCLGLFRVVQINIGTFQWNCMYFYLKNVLVVNLTITLVMSFTLAGALKYTCAHTHTAHNYCTFKERLVFCSMVGTWPFFSINKNKIRWWNVMVYCDLYKVSLKIN